MKRLVAFLLLSAMLCFCFPSSFAEAQETAAPWSTGIRMTLPESMTGAKGTVVPGDQGELTPGSGIFITDLLYIPMAPEAFSALQARIRQIDPEDPEALSAPENAAVIGEYSDMIQAVAPVCTFVTVSGQEIEGAFAQYLPGVLDSYTVHSLGILDEVRYYLLMLKKDSEVYKSIRIPEDFREEYEGFISDPGALSAGITLGEPPAGSVQLPDLSSLELKDLDGQSVNPAEVFAQHQVTMVNIWATYCGYCIDEFPELEELNREMAEKDCAVIGICTDLSGGNTALARQILDECGVTYLNLYVTEESLQNLALDCVPTSFFVSRDGAHLTDPVYGAMMAAYREKFSEALRQDAEAPEGAESSASEASGAVFCVLAADGDGNPVPDVSVTFCDDASCILRKTGADGRAVLEGVSPAEYHVQVLKAPDGYKLPEVTNFIVGPEGGTVRLQVTKE